MNHTPEEVQRRLEILRRKLELDGEYVRANTVILAQELIRDLSGVAVPPASLHDTVNISGDRL